MRHRPLLAPMVLGILSVLAPLGCTESGFCPDCSKSSPILGLAYQPTNLYTAGTPISANLPNPSGGTPATYLVVSGTLPPGLALDPRTGHITGNPTTPGVYTVTIQGSNATNAASQVLTITVVSATPLAVAYGTPVVFSAGTAIATQSPTLDQATTGISTTYAVTAGVLPTGLSLSTVSGDITGTPTAAGVYPFTVTATNGTRSATANVSYTVTPAGSLILNYVSPLVFTAGSSITPQVASLATPTPGVSTTFALTAGALPNGLALATDGSISGTPTTPGVSTFTVTATNGTRTATSTPTWTVTSSAPFMLVYDTPKVFTQGTVIASQAPTLASATPGVSTLFTVTGGALPAGLGLDASTGLITGTPTTPGVFAFTVAATNGTRSATATATYTVESSATLTAAYPTPRFFPSGSAIPTQTPTLGQATPGLATTWSVTSGGLPPGLTLQADGTITGTPTVVGIYPFTVTATNGSRTASAPVTYTIETTSTLSLVYTTPRYFPAGSAIATQSPAVVNETTGVTSTFAVTSGSLPAGLTLNADGTLTGTPTVPGVYPFTVTATNGSRTASCPVAYTVETVAALSLSYVTPRYFPVGSAIAAQSPTVGNATPGVTTTYAVTSGSLPTGLTLNADGTLTGTPTVSGVYAFTVTATNGTRTASKAVVYTVENTSILTLGYPTPQYFTAGAAIPTQSPTVGNGTPGVTTTYAVTAGTLPAGLTLNADGTLTGTPTVPGVYAFTVTATNGTRTASRPVAYTIENSAPLTLGYVTPQTFTAQTAIATQTPSISNETTGVTTTFAVTAGSLPTGLTLNTDGTITGTPTVPGVSAFTVTATNGTRTASSPMTYTVQALPPTALNYTTPVTYTSGVAITPNVPNPSGGTPTAYSITGGSLPAGLSLDLSTGVISGTPTASGSFSVTIRGDNGAGNISQTVAMTVLPPVVANLSANPGTVSVGQSSSLTAIFSGGTGTVDQSLGTVTNGAGVTVGPFSQVGTYAYTLTVTNSAGVSVSSTATITVVPTPPNSVTFTVPTTGTTYTYGTPGVPLSGLQVVVPDQGSAVCASTDLTVTRQVGQAQPGALATGVVAVSDPWTFSSTVGYPFRKPFTVTIPYDASGLGASDVPVPFFWDPAYSKWVAVGLKAFNPGAQTVTFTTLLPGSYSVLAIPGLASSLSTASLGFAVGTDGWFQPDQATFDLPGGSSFGMSSFASWYFAMKKSANGNAGLYSQFLEGSPTSATDDVSARALISRLANATQENWGSLWTQGAYQLTNLQTGLALLTGLRASGQPQVFMMSEARPAVDNGLATVVTGYNAGTGKFDVLDPNFPGLALTITWNSTTGAFTAYDRASAYAPSFAQYAFEGQTSVHRLADYERAFTGANTAFPNPPFATLTVTDVSGAGAPSGSTALAVPSANNVVVTGTVSNGSDTATHIYWSQNGGTRTAVPLSGTSFSFTIPALADPYGTRVSLETTANPCDPTFSYTGYTEFNVKELGRTPWFPNICFELGSSNPWTLEQGLNGGVNYPASPTLVAGTGFLSAYAITWNVGSIDSALVTVGNDANVPSIPSVYDGSSAFRVNNPATGAHISRIYQDIVVPTDVSVPKLSFYWAAVMQSAGHTAAQQPFVDIAVQDLTLGQTIFFKHFYANDPSYPGWIAGNGSGNTQWFGITWQKVILPNLTARKGNTLRILVMAADCTQGGHGGYAYLDGTTCN